MRYFVFPFILALVLLTGCGNPIKDDAAVVEVEPGTETTSVLVDAEQSTTPPATGVSADRNASPLGNWVGEFRQANRSGGDKSISNDEVIFWNRENKISISVEAVRGDSVFGRSVVAGNDRPFVGTLERRDDNTFYSVREPGDDRYDGAFKFRIIDNQLIGTWTAYKDIDIKEREYRLDPKTFVYDPAVQLDEYSQYVDWKKSAMNAADYNDDGMTGTWVREEFASSTDKIYTLNASTDRLTKEQVENLKKGDLTIIRNTIYARHGYSFKNRPLRVFFDAQPWYIPVHADIKADFTDIEKENIQLLLKYEKNAAEFYDYFGRG